MILKNISSFPVDNIIYLVLYNLYQKKKKCTIMISTHVAYKKLVSKGMSDELAEAVTEIIEQRQDNLVTKSDLKLGLSELKSELKQDMSDFKSDIFGWAIPTVIGVVSLNIAILGAIIALWFKV